jgi:hypothetical protein
MEKTFTRNDIRAVGDNMYQIGAVEFEIVQGSPYVGYKNVEVEESGSATIDDIRRDFGDDVAAFFQEKLGT